MLLLNNYSRDYELEIRKGSFKNNKFSATISKQEFEEMLKKSIDHYPSFKKMNYSIQYFNNNIKKIVYENGEIDIVKKIKKRKIDMIPYNIRIALSKEVLMKSLPISCNSYLTLDRIRYTFQDSLYKIELAIDTLKNKKKLYRYEIEFTKRPSQMDLTSIIEKM